MPPQARGDRADLVRKLAEEADEFVTVTESALGSQRPQPSSPASPGWHRGRPWWAPARWCPANDPAAAEPADRPRSGDQAARRRAGAGEVADRPLGRHRGDGADRFRACWAWTGRPAVWPGRSLSRAGEAAHRLSMPRLGYLPQRHLGVMVMAWTDTASPVRQPLRRLVVGSRPATAAVGLQFERRFASTRCAAQVSGSAHGRS